MAPAGVHRRRAVFRLYRPPWRWTVNENGQDRRGVQLQAVTAPFVFLPRRAARVPSPSTTRCWSVPAQSSHEPRAAPARKSAAPRIADGGGVREAGAARKKEATTGLPTATWAPRTACSSSTTGPRRSFASSTLSATPSPSSPPSPAPASSPPRRPGTQVTLIPMLIDGAGLDDSTSPPTLVICLTAGAAGGGISGRGWCHGGTSALGSRAVFVGETHFVLVVVST
ncbi:hypothetical protein GQ55_9G603100 [Panicum hallii var. hallii]|uniref:Uncharacterized protein n=1 Tax=Panicum hallii var. hallii TaxID=1504633 RepID=A0A2T7CHH5_9POAL|nr:hypothetical protein GQ55_9G603100 [Panicum hallii var. hallii]